MPVILPKAQEVFNLTLPPFRNPRFLIRDAYYALSQIEYKGNMVKVHKPMTYRFELIKTKQTEFPAIKHITTPPLWQGMLGFWASAFSKKFPGYHHNFNIGLADDSWKLLPNGPRCFPVFYIRNERWDFCSEKVFDPNKWLWLRPL